MLRPGASSAPYLRIIASLVPRDLILKREQERDFSQLSFSELMDFLDTVRLNANFEREIIKAKLAYRDRPFNVVPLGSASPERQERLL